MRGTRYEMNFRHGRPYLYRVDLQNQSTKRIALAADTDHDNDWLIDANGEVAATYDINLNNGRWTIRNASRDVIAEGQTEAGRSGLIGLGKGGRSVIYYEYDEQNRSRRFEVRLSGGTPVRFLKGIDIDQLFFDARTGYMTGYTAEDADSDPVFDDPARADAVRKIQKVFSAYSMSMFDWSDDLNHVIVRTSGQQDSGSWFTVDVANLSAKAFAYERMAIGPQQVGPFSTFEYTASDGTEMDGILTLPPGREARDLPLVMLPHGGPHSYDSERFDWWAQAFASRGYAVFQPNFRGSTNRGGGIPPGRLRRMGTQNADRQVRWVKGAGRCWNRRSGPPCIVGASYGGYAALDGVTLQNGIYRCSVAVAP